MPFEKEFEPGVDFTPLREKHNDFLDFSIDSNTLKILNRDAYRMFVAKLIGFNNKYAPKIDRSIRENEEAYKQNRFVNTKYPIDIDKFFRINHRWRSIAMKYYARLDDPTGLKKIQDYRPEDQFPSSQIELLKESTKEVCIQLSKVVSDLNLGTPYTDSQGKEQMDYTEISYELTELILLATHAYTDVFKILDREYGPNALDKMSDLTASMHILTYYDEGYTLPRRSLSRDHSSSSLISSPLLVRNMFAGYTEENFVGFPGKLAELEKKREEEAKKTTPEQREEIRRRNEEYLKKKQEEDRIAEELRKEEERKIREQEKAERIAQEEENRIQSLKEDDEKLNKAFPIVENDPNPSKINQPFYAYFNKFAERMGIDQSDLNAQSIIQAASIASITENIRSITENSVDAEPLVRDMTAIYRQVSRIAYKSYIEKCISENRPIDLDVPSNEALDLMGVVMYTMYPTVFNGEKSDPTLSIVANQVISGAMVKYDLDTKSDTIELVKLSYEEKDLSFFTADGEARFESFTAQKRSSTSIVEETASIVNSYDQYKKNRMDPQINSENLTDTKRTAFGEGKMRKMAMDAAYALERRVETRYKSWISKVFRYFSYSKQVDELARVKSVLGIPKDHRVADHIKEYRIADIFTDVNKKTQTAQIMNLRKEIVGDDSKKYISNLLEKALGAENVPHITYAELEEEKYERFKKFYEMTPEAVEYEKQRQERERLEKEKEEERREEEERLRREEEEKLKEQENSKKEEIVVEEESIIEEDPVVEEDHEPLITEAEYAKKVYEEKEKLFNDKIKILTTNRDAAEKLRKSKENERNAGIKKNQEIFAQMERDAQNYRDANDELNSHIYFLQGQIAETSKQLADRAIENTNLEDQAAEDAKQKSSFFSKVGSIFTSQKTKDEEAKKEAEKEEIRDESKKAVKDTNKVLEELKEEIDKYVAQVELNKQAADKLDKDKWIYDGRAAKLKTDLSSVELEAAKEVKSYQRQIENLMKDKDKIIESGDGLNFDEQLFKKNLMETLQAERKAKAEEANVNENEKKRVSISIDDANENAPVEPKKEEIAKEDISLQK